MVYESSFDPGPLVATPSVSVIVPVYNDAKGIADTLDSLLNQSLNPDEYEILVVDNGSTDGSLEVVREYGGGNARVIALEEHRIRGSYAARNKGIANAQGGVLAFIDANVTVPPEYLQSLLRYLHHGELEYMGCRVEVVASADGLAEKYDSIHAFPTDKYFELYGFVPTCCLSVRRELLQRTGPFDERLESGGDTEFAKRAERAQARKGFAQDLTVRHPARKRYSELLRKRMRLARGAAQLNYLDPVHFRKKRFLISECLLPSNPLRIARDAVERRVSLTVPEAVVLSTFKLPLAWAYCAAFLRESRRLNACFR